MTTPTPTQPAVVPEAQIVADICQAVAELPDRNSPEDWPEAMLVTHEELAAIVRDALSAAAPAVAPAGFVPAAAYDRLQALTDSQSARIIGLEDAYRTELDKLSQRNYELRFAPQAEQPGSVPDGWKLVPVKPTREMCDAAVRAICYGPEGGFTRISGPGKSWVAMLDAAPAAPMSSHKEERHE